MALEIASIREAAEGRTSEWGTVAEAADRAGVSTSTVRQWYRSGQLATQRSTDRGAFLVPLADVVALADDADAHGDAVEDSVIDINAAYWSAETEAARAQAAASAEEADRLADALDDAVARAEAANGHVSFLRTQLAEANSESGMLRGRIAELEAQVAELVTEAGELRRAATFSSLTDNAWLDAAPEGYRGPSRAQDPFGTAAVDVDVTAEVDVDVDAAAEVDVDDPAPEARAPIVATVATPDTLDLPGIEDIDMDDVVPGDVAAPPPVRWTAAAFGGHEDDLLPVPDRRRR